MAANNNLDALPVSVRPDGENADLFATKKVTVTRALFDTYCERDGVLNRPLTDEHIAVLSEWVMTQPDDRPDTAASRGFELPMMLRQVCARSIMNGDVSEIGLLTKAAFVMGAWAVDVRENTWQALRYPRQVGDATEGNGMELVRQAAQRIGPVAAAAFEQHAPSVDALPPLPVVWHQPANVPLVEPVWTSRSQAEDLARNVYWTDPEDLIYDHHQHVWATPEPAFLPQVPPGGWEVTGDTQADVVDALNAFLCSGSPGDAVRASQRDPQNEYGSLLGWAARYWAGPQWRRAFPEVADLGVDGPIAERFVTVRRDGRAQITWRADRPKPLSTAAAGG